jgi:hypothetical protein
MNSLENKMETITLIEIFLPQLLAEAESARISAEQALRNVEAETAAERAKMAERYEKLCVDIPAQKQRIWPLQECIRVKARTGLDAASDMEQLAQAEALVIKMEAEHKELLGKFRPQEERTKELIAEATITLTRAADSEKKVRARIGKAIIAHDAHQANPAIGIGPIPKFKTLRDAVRHFYKIGFSLTNEGTACQAFIGDLAWPSVTNGEIDGMMPESLGWLGRFEPFKTLPCPGSRTHIYEARLTSETEFNRLFGRTPNNNIRLTTDRKILCFIEESGNILANHTAAYVTMPGKSGTENFSDLFGSWEDALVPSLKELSSHGTLDLKAQGDLPMLAELVREAWKIAAAGVTSKRIFQGGQGRLTESKINDLVGPYWKAFINSPWEHSIQGTYALLKYRCARGEIPNVYSFEVQGHFGFRVRTPDHDWIIGEIYCPPDHFNPGETPDPTKLTNLESYGDDWIAELGPVKFYIRKATSRT